MEHGSVANLRAVSAQYELAQGLRKHPALRPAPEDFSPWFLDLKIVPLSSRKTQDEGLLPLIAHLQFHGDKFAGFKSPFSDNNSEVQVPFCR